MKTVRILKYFITHDPYMNFALEEAIMRLVGQSKIANTIRFWVNDEAIVIGANRSIGDEINIQACKKYGVRIVRGFSDGNPVYYDRGILVFSLIFKKDLLNEIMITEILNKAVSETFKSIGLRNVSTKKDSVLVDSKKMAELSKVGMWGSTVAHVILFIDPDIELLSEIIKIRNGSKNFYERLETQVTSLHKELGNSVSLEKLINRLIYFLQKELSDFIFKEDKYSNEELELAKKLYEEKYANLSWMR